MGLADEGLQGSGRAAVRSLRDIQHRPEQLSRSSDPLNCPEDRSRRSIATYYYTSPESGLENVPRRTTNFKARPGSDDKADYRIKLRHLAADWMPPGAASKAGARFGVTISSGSRFP